MRVGEEERKTKREKIKTLRERHNMTATFGFIGPRYTYTKCSVKGRI